MLQKLFHECTAHSHEERCCSRWHARCLRTDAATTATARSWQVTVAAASPRAVPGVDVALPADAGSLALPSLRLGGVALEIVSNNALCRLVHVFQRALILGLLGLAVLVLGCGRHRPVVGAALLLACALALERRLGPAAVKQRPENLREPCSAQQQGKAIAQASATGLDAEASVLCCGPFQISDMGRYYPQGGPNLQRPPMPNAARGCHCSPAPTSFSRFARTTTVAWREGLGLADTKGRCRMVSIAAPRALTIEELLGWVVEAN